MLKEFIMPAFKRQKEKLPEVISVLESIAKHRELTQSTVATLVLGLAHDLRGQLTVVSLVLELEEIKGDQENNP
jgi:hypothetical protein